MRSRFRVCLATVSATLVLLPALSCRTADPPMTGDDATSSVIIFAAASTAGPLDEIADAFRAETGIDVYANLAGSSTLAQQIIEGAEADIFLSASREWAAPLENRGLVGESRDLVSNRLVIVVPAAADCKINAPEDLLNPRIEHLALGDPQSVPAGVYARQALQTLGLWDRLAGKVVAADDVRQALTYVETGAAEAGIVYVTDAAASRRVDVAAEIDPALSAPIVYPAVLLRSAAGKPAARRLFRFLQSTPAADILRHHGFTVIDSSSP